MAQNGNLQNRGSAILALDLDETAVVGWYGEEVDDLSLGNDAVRIRNNYSTMDGLLATLVTGSASAQGVMTAMVLGDRGRSQACRNTCSR